MTLALTALIARLNQLKRRNYTRTLNLCPTQSAPPMSLTPLKLPHLIVVGQEITSPRRETPKGAKNKGKHSHSKAQMERLEKSMRDLEDNQTIICHRFDILVELSTKVMHSATTTLQFIQANKEQKDLRKTTKETHSIYEFMVEDRLKTILERLVKVEEENAVREVLEEQDNRNSKKEEGNQLGVFFFCYYFMIMSLNFTSHEVYLIMSIIWTNSNNMFKYC